MEIALSLRDLKKSFGNFPAVDGVSLDVPKGHIFGLIGPNGAGKTTTIRMIMDIIRPDSGDISVFGQGAPKMPSLRASPVPTPSRNRPWVRTALVAAAWAMIAGWMRTVGQVTAVVMGSSHAWLSAPIIDHTNEL